MINLRRTPPLTGPQLKKRLEAWVAAFNKRTGAALVAGGFYDDEPLAFDPRSKLVRRLLAAYTRATGLRAAPAISGGGTYAKRMPNSIAFGMWFPGKPYPGHDVDEQVPDHRPAPRLPRAHRDPGRPGLQRADRRSLQALKICCRG